MATATVQKSARSSASRPADPWAELKRRVAALGDFTLYVTDDELLVAEHRHNPDRYEVVYMHDNAVALVAEWLDPLEREHEHNVPAPAIDALKTRFEALGLRVFELEAKETNLTQFRFHVACADRNKLLNHGGLTIEGLADYCDQLEREAAQLPFATVRSLKHRVAALGPYELVITDAGEQLVLEKLGDGRETIVLAFARRNDGDDELVEHWLEPRELAREQPEAAAVRRQPDFVTRSSPKAQLVKLEHEIQDELHDAVLSAEQTDLHEQPGAAEKLPAILKLATQLANDLNDFCGTAHVGRVPGEAGGAA